MMFFGVLLFANDEVFSKQATDLQLLRINSSPSDNNPLKDYCNNMAVMLSKMRLEILRDYSFMDRLSLSERKMYPVIILSQEIVSHNSKCNY